MEFNELIKQRRSVRSYAENRQPGRALMEEILRQAQMAPSWKNSQTARCYAVLDEDKVKQLREECLPTFNQNSTKGAGAYIVTTFVKNVAAFTSGTPDDDLANHWGAYDLGLHDAYLILAAKNAGLDTLIMGIRDVKALRTLLQIPENEEVMSVIAVGLRASEPSLRPRKALGEVTHIL